MITKIFAESGFRVANPLKYNKNEIAILYLSQARHLDIVGTKIDLIYK